MEGEGQLYNPEIDPGKFASDTQEQPGPGLSLDTSAREALQHELDVLAAEGRSVKDLTGGMADRLSHLNELAQVESGKE